MDQHLGFLRETLSNHLDNHQVCQEIYQKLESNSYEDEVAFLEDLDENEGRILNLILQHELDFARQEKDEVRVEQLNGVYERLY